MSELYINTYPYYCVSLIGHDVMLEQQVACGERIDIARMTPDELSRLLGERDALRGIIAELLPGAKFANGCDHCCYEFDDVIERAEAAIEGREP